MNESRKDIIPFKPISSERRSLTSLISLSLSVHAWPNSQRRIRTRGAKIYPLGPLFWVKEGEKISKSDEVSPQQVGRERSPLGAREERVVGTRDREEEEEGGRNALRKKGRCVYSRRMDIVVVEKILLGI